MSFTPVGTTDTLETFRTRYNATSITLVDDSSTSVDITLATDSLKISGGTGIASAISGDVITLSASDASTSAKGIASFNSDNFAVSSGAVTIKDGGVIRAEIAADAIDGTKLADNAIDSEHYTDGSIDTEHIANDAITADKLANTAVTAATYGSGSAIPVIAVDAQGRITGVTTAAASSDLTISDTSSTTEVITLGSEQLKFTGSGGVTATISSGTVTYTFDNKVKVSSNDTTSGFLNGKLVAGTGVSFTEGSDGGDETLTISSGAGAPTITSIAPDVIPNTATDIVITGTNYVTTPNVELIASTGVITQANTIVRNSATQLTINATLGTDGDYFIRIENPDGNAVRSGTAILGVSDAPTWSTSAGSLGDLAAGGSTSFAVSGSSDSTVRYDLVSGALPSGYSLNTATGAITGTENAATEETTFNFTIRLSDAESQELNRAFSITVTVGMANSGQFN
jgi:hypothetical protein